MQISTYQLEVGYTVKDVSDGYVFTVESIVPHKDTIIVTTTSGESITYDYSDKFIRIR